MLWTLVAGLALASPASAQDARIIRTIGDSTFYPEGVAYDAHTGTIYVASVRHGTIARVVGDSLHEILPRHSPGVAAVLGVRVHGDYLFATTSGIPWYAGYTPADSAIAALLKIRLADGLVVQRWDVPPAVGGHVLGDVEIVGDDVAFSDSKQPVLYIMRASTGKLEEIRDTLFRSLQGMATSADPSVLYVADYSRGLLRVDLASRHIDKVLSADGKAVRGIDGLQRYKSSLIGVYNGSAPGRIVRIDLDPAGRVITDVAVLHSDPSVADEPTIGAVMGDEYVYVANSQWEKYSNNGVRNGNGRLVPPILVKIRL